MGHSSNSSYWQSGLSAPSNLPYYYHLILLSKLLVVNRGSADAICALALFMTQLLHVLLAWTILLLKNRIGFDVLELGLESVDVVPVRAAVGTTSSIGELVPVVLRLGTRRAPAPSNVSKRR